MLLQYYSNHHILDSEYQILKRISWSNSIRNCDGFCNPCRNSLVYTISQSLQGVQGVVSLKVFCQNIPTFAHDKDNIMFVFSSFIKFNLMQYIHCHRYSVHFSSLYGCLPTSYAIYELHQADNQSFLSDSLLLLQCLCFSNSKIIWHNFIIQYLHTSYNTIYPLPNPCHSFLPHSKMHGLKLYLKLALFTEISKEGKRVAKRPYWYRRRNRIEKDEPD